MGGSFMTETATLSPLRTIARNSAIGYLGVVAALLLNFVTKVILARALPVSELGLLFTGQAVVGLVLVVAQLSLPEAVVRFVGMYAGQEMARAKGYIVNALWLSGLFSVLLALGLGLGAGWIADALHEQALAQVLLLLAVAIPLTTLADVLAAVGRGLSQLWTKVVLVDLTRSLWVVLALGSLLLLKASSLSAVVWAYVTAAFVSAVFTVIWLKRNAHWQVSASPTPVAELLRYGLPLLGSALLAGPLVNSALPLLLQRLASSQAVAYYNVALSLPILIYIPIAVVEQAALPVWAAQSQAGATSDLRASYALVTRWAFLAGSFVFTLLWFNASAILTMVYGPSYATAAPAVQAVAVVTLFGMAVGPNAGMLRAFADTHFFFACMVIAGIVSLAVGMILIPTWGLMGGVLGFVTASALTNSLFAVVLFARHRIHPVDGAFLRTMIASMLSLAITWVLWGHIGSGFVGIISSVAVYGLVLGGLGFSLRAFTLQDSRIMARAYRIVVSKAKR